MEMSRISIGCHRLMVGWSLRVCVCVTYATMRHTHTMCAARRVPRRCDSINNDYYGWACNPKRYTANVAIFCLVCCCCFLFVFILRLLLLWLSDLWICGWLSPGRKCVASIVRTEFSILFISNNKSVLRLIRLAEWRRTAFFCFFVLFNSKIYLFWFCAQGNWNILLGLFFWWAKIVCPRRFCMFSFKSNELKYEMLMTTSSAQNKRAVHLFFLSKCSNKHPNSAQQHQQDAYKYVYMNECNVIWMLQYILINWTTNLFKWNKLVHFRTPYYLLVCTPIIYYTQSE